MTLSLGQARATAQDMLQRAQHLPMARMEPMSPLANTLFWLGTAKKPGLPRPRRSWRGTPGGADMQGFDLSTLALTLEGIGRVSMRTLCPGAHRHGYFAPARQRPASHRVQPGDGLAGWLAGRPV